MTRDIAARKKRESCHSGASPEREKKKNEGTPRARAGIDPPSPAPRYVRERGMTKRRDFACAPPPPPGERERERGLKTADCLCSCAFSGARAAFFVPLAVSCVAILARGLYYYGVFSHSPGGFVLQALFLYALSMDVASGYCPTKARRAYWNFGRSSACVCLCVRACVRACLWTCCACFC